MPKYVVYVIGEWNEALKSWIPWQRTKGRAERRHEQAVTEEAALVLRSGSG